MKEKLLIYQGDPCLMDLDDPSIQTVTDVRGRGQIRCKYLSDRKLCSPPRFGCIKKAGLRVARRVLDFYNEANERNLTIEIEQFFRKGSLPPEEIEAYVDTSDYGNRYVQDPGVVVQRVADYARKVLDLKPGERVPRNTKDPLNINSQSES